jgi:fatty acid desaturase
MALLNAWNEASQAILWRNVRRRFEETRTTEVQIARKVQSAAEEIDHFDLKKEAVCREWKAIFSQFYARGRQNGARKETLASVVRKSSVVGAVAAVPAVPLAILLPFTFAPALLAVPVVVGVGLFTYFNHRRHHPDHDRYLAQEATRFAVIPDAPRVRELPVPSPRFLTKGDSE